MNLERSSGVLLHPTSLPGKYGIGTFGKEAYEFVDILSHAEQKLWQILPLGPTGFGDSPYQCFSAFAGNTLLIDLNYFVELGYFSESEIPEFVSENNKNIDYESVKVHKLPLLETAYRKFSEIASLDDEAEFHAFCIENSDWLEDYAFFMSLKEEFALRPWYEWDNDIKLRKSNALNFYSEKLEERTEFHKFLQFIFFKQWNLLKNYANSHGIKIIGDIPLYVSYDSSDAWANNQLFLFDGDLKPIQVAGVPPDYFSETGQMWGNPIFNWKKMEKNGFKWWIKRIQNNIKMFDIIRIDHFRGLSAYWSIPYGEETAINGSWVNAPGVKLFEVVKSTLGNIQIIAEDLGVMTPDVEELRDSNNFPGMKILQFAFDASEENNYLPHTYTKNFIVYTGTHDNDTIVGWYNKANETDKLQFHNYSGYFGEEINWAFIRLAFSSVADIAIIPVQDLLGLDSDARFNLPGTSSGNWKWKLENFNQLNLQIDKLRLFTKIYGRGI